MLFVDQSYLEKFDYIVVGAGISGLTTALILAKEGKKVAIFERNSDIAPLLRPYKRKGVSISPGLHVCGWMGKGEIVEKFLNYLNVSDGVEKVLSENGYGTVIVNNKIYNIPRGYEAIKEALCFYFPDYRQTIINYLDLIKECVDQIFYFNHSLPPLKNLHTSFIDASNSSFRVYLQKHNAPEELIELLDAMSYLLVGSRGNELPFLMHSFVIGGFFQSPGFFPFNGITRMLDNFKRELSKYGVKIFLNKEIKKVLVDEKKQAIGVETVDGKKYSSSNVIVTFNPKLLVSMLDKGVLRPIFIKRLEDAQNTFGFYVAYYKVKRELKITSKSIVFYDGHRDLLIGLILNENSNCYVLSAFMPENETNFSYEKFSEEQKKELAMKKLQLIEDTIYNILPEIKNDLELISFLKPWSFEKYTKTVNGSAYGTKQSVDYIGFQHKIPVKNLYLVGQSIYPGFLGAMISAFSLCLEILESNSFWAKVVENETK